MDAKQVFLISGQVQEVKVGGRQGVSAAVAQRVVIAADGRQAYAVLAQKEPTFSPLGLATLHDYESAAQTLRDVAEGRSAEWVMHVA